MQQAAWWVPSPWVPAAATLPISLRRLDAPLHSAFAAPKLNVCLSVLWDWLSLVFNPWGGS